MLENLSLNAKQFDDVIASAIERYFDNSDVITFPELTAATSIAGADIIPGIFGGVDQSITFNLLQSTLSLTASQISNFNSAVNAYIVSIENIAGGLPTLDSSKNISTNTLINGTNGTLTLNTNLNAQTVSNFIASAGQANGLGTLDMNGKLLVTQLPSIAVTTVNTVSSQAAMLALSVNQGAVCIRSDLNETFILAQAPAFTLANWVEFLFPMGGVTSWQGNTGGARTGNVVAQTGDYTTAMVSEMTNLYYTDARVRAAALTGFSATNFAIIATDTVLSAFNKAQGQINANITAIAAIGGRNVASGYVGLDSLNSTSIAGKLSLATSIASLSILGIGGGAGNAGALIANQLEFQYGGASGGFSHYIKTWHDSTGASINNKLQVYLNTSSSVGGSSAPATGNALAFEMNGLGCIVPGTLGVTGVITASTAISVGSAPLNLQNSVTSNYGIAWGKTTYQTYLNLGFDGTHVWGFGGVTLSQNNNSVITQLLIATPTLTTISTPTSIGYATSAPTLANSRWTVWSNSAVPTLRMTNSSGVATDYIIPGGSAPANLNDQSLKLHTSSTQNYLQYIGSGSSVKTSFNTYAIGGPILVGDTGWAAGTVTGGGTETILAIGNATDTNIYSTNFYTSGSCYLQNGNTQYGMTKIASGATWGLTSYNFPSGGSAFFGYSGIAIGSYNTGTSQWTWAAYCDNNQNFYIKNVLSVGSYVTAPQYQAVGAAPYYSLTNTGGPAGQTYGEFKSITRVIGPNTATIIQANCLNGASSLNFFELQQVVGATSIVINATAGLTLSTDLATKTATSTWSVSSTKKYKNLLGLVSAANDEMSSLDKINALNVYYYQHTDERAKEVGEDLNNKPTHIGLVIEEVKATIPEAVNGEKLSYHHIYKHMLVAQQLLCKEVKSLKNQITQLKKAA
jgi:hypothetical protein